MFQLCSKPRKLKKELRKLNKEYFSDLSQRVADARNELSNIQQLLMTSGGDEHLCHQERTAAGKLRSLSRAEESFQLIKKFITEAPKSHS